MKGKQVILRYLEKHRTFTAKDVATECGMTINCITKNAIDLERARKIVRVIKVWRTETYRLATPEEQDGTARSYTNGIFQDCPTVRIWR
ncbi:protein ren [Enterobacter bugandensis]|uniref:protein ren n=1 Tax=Enterobacter bugandensis TaxID=881260 RepID=UPI0020068F55|nr:protein ren [Enterobacter bugandensis]MCK7195677.1 protein ren [Enterobacter bugandensis]